LADDVLAKVSPAEVAAFYSRLADIVDKNKGAVTSSLAATLMREWLKNRDPAAKLELEMPSHLINHSQVKDVLKIHRRVFLTEEKTKKGVWGGIVPRWKDGRWKGVGALQMQYESLVEFPLRYQATGSAADKDLLYALHGFQLRSNVSVAMSSQNGPNINVVFSQYESRVVDRYDWDYSEHLTVPNPDHGSKEPNAVAPQSQTVVVYHKNAKRIEDAKLAAPYDIESKPWKDSDVTITGPATVNIAKAI
jgi:hypothetical protein